MATSEKEVIERFWDKVDVGQKDECWEWQAATNDRGYGQLWNGHKVVYAHRFSLKLSGRKYTDEKQVTDHLCRNPLCVNPRHLEAVSNRTNTLRGKAGEVRKRRRARVTECPHGHPLSGENLYVTPQGARQCRECHRKANRKWAAKKRAREARERRLAESTA